MPSKDALIVEAPMGEPGHYIVKPNYIRGPRTKTVDKLAYYQCMQCGEYKRKNAFSAVASDEMRAHHQRCRACKEEHGRVLKSIRHDDGTFEFTFRSKDQYQTRREEKELKKRGEALRRGETRKRREQREKEASEKRRDHMRKVQADKRRKQLEEAAAKASENEAARELASRELSRRHLIPFIKRMKPKYDAGWVHKDVAMRLERFSQQVKEGLSPRLMLQMPPRVGKSEEASIQFPSWHLGRCPEHEIIMTTYSGTLATGFSRKVRANIRDPDYSAVFPGTKVDRENSNAEGWMTTKGGGFVPSGVGGPITGKGAHILIIDDPVKNAEEAESATMRENIYEWYQSTAYTRLAPGGGVLIIQTRWHLDDLSGRLEHLMSKEAGDEFEIVRYPAIAVEKEEYRDIGEALHPSRYDEQALARIERAVGPRVWAALYQQNPIMEDARYFDIDTDIMYYTPEERPEKLIYYSAWDLAISKNDRADYTVGLVFGVDEDLDIWLVQMVRRRMDGEEIVEAILDAHELWDTELDGIEKGHIQLAIGAFLDQRVEERELIGFTAEELPPGRQDKELRARPTQALLKQHRIHFPAQAAWLEPLLAEMKEFPFNRNHDDCVDALAWVGRMLAVIDGPTDTKKERKKRAPQSFRDKLNKVHRTNQRKSAMAA